MPASFNGAVTLAGELPGVAPAVDVANAAFADVNRIIAELAAQIRLCKSLIRVPAVTGLEFSLSGSLSASAALSVQFQDPAAYLANLVAAAEQVLVALEAFNPVPTINLQLDAQLALQASLDIQIGLIDASLGLLDPIIDAMLALLQRITAAVNAVAALVRLLAVSGGYSFSFAGPLSSLGADLNAVTPQAGIDLSAPILAAIFLAPDANASARAAIAAIFKVPPGT